MCELLEISFKDFLDGYIGYLGLASILETALSEFFTVNDIFLKPLGVTSYPYFLLAKGAKF